MDNNFQGELTELEFVKKCLMENIIPAKPVLATRYDYVVDNFKIQIKSTRYCHPTGSYILNVCRRNTAQEDTSYRSDEFDFLVAHVIPLDIWYIIPINEIVGKYKIRLGTRNGKFEKYRESWNLIY